jgi:NAD(P)-dependent dehydrogenase (short-subunit alcohol dehydrogenase family)
VSPLTSVEGAVALVTGGRRGLGGAYVDALVRHRAVKVYATARKPASSEDPRVAAETLEVTDPEPVRSLAERTDDVSIVVNSAGVLIPGPLSKSTTDDVRATFGTNVFGALHVAQTYAPILASNGGGALVNMLSVFSWATGAGEDEVLVDQLTEHAKAALAGPVDGLAIDRLPG